eukprot:502313_1
MHPCISKQNKKQPVNLKMSNSVSSYSVHGGKGIFTRSECGKRPLSTRCLPNNKVHANNSNTNGMYNINLRTMVNNNTNNNNINNDNDDNKMIENATNNQDTSNSNKNRKRKMKFVENSEKKKKKYNDYNKDITKYLKKITTIQEEMGEYVLNREMQMQQVTDEKEENVKKIQNLKNIIENNKNKETELIEKCNLFERKNMQQQTQIELLMQQKQILESNCLKWDTLYKDGKKRLSNEKQLTKQLNEKIININKANKRKKK